MLLSDFVAEDSSKMKLPEAGSESRESEFLLVGISMTSTVSSSSSGFRSLHALPSVAAVQSLLSERFNVGGWYCASSLESGQTEVLVVVVAVLSWVRTEERVTSSFFFRWSGRRLCATCQAFGSHGTHNDGYNRLLEILL